MIIGYRCGRSLKWDPAKEEFIGDDEGKPRGTAWSKSAPSQAATFALRALAMPRYHSATLEIAERQEDFFGRLPHMPLLISSSFFRLFLRSLRLIPSRRIRLLAVHAPALLVCALMAFSASTIAAAAAKTYRLKETDLKQPVIWGATCEAPDGAGLSFGGEDQQADDGCSHTRVRTGAAWQDIHPELRAASPLEALRGRTWAIRSGVKTAAACARSICLRGLASEEGRRLLKANLAPMLEKAAGIPAPLSMSEWLAGQPTGVAPPRSGVSGAVEQHTSDQGGPRCSLQQSSPDVLPPSPHESLALNSAARYDPERWLGV